MKPFCLFYARRSPYDVQVDPKLFMQPHTGLCGLQTVQTHLVKTILQYYKLSTHALLQKRYTPN